MSNWSGLRRHTLDTTPTPAQPRGQHTLTTAGPVSIPPTQRLVRAPKKRGVAANILDPAMDDLAAQGRDPMNDHWGRLLIDATKPWGRAAEFERKRIPGEGAIRVDDYL